MPRTLWQSLPQDKRIRQLIHIVSLAAPRAALTQEPYLLLQPKA